MAGSQGKFQATKAGLRDASPEQLRELREMERRLRDMLATRFQRRWIEEHAGDLFAQAQVEYAEWLETNKPARHPPGWLAQRVLWRALNLVEREARQAGPPLDSVIHMAEDPQPTPEEAVLEEDRRRRLAKAISHLSEKERRLVALVHYEEQSITEAGRLLGWGKTSASEHHAEAMEKIKALLGPRDLIGQPPPPFLIGLAAQASLVADRDQRAGGNFRRLAAAAQDVSDVATRPFSSASRRVAEAARRALPFTDTGVAAASGGLGRGIAQCGTLVGAAICSAILFSAIDPGSGLDVIPHSPGPSTRRPAEPTGPHPNPIIPTRSTRPQTIEGPLRARALAEAERRTRRRAKRHSRIARSHQAHDGQPARGGKARHTSIDSASAEEAAAPPEEVTAPEATGGQVQQTFNPFNTS